MQTTHKEVLDMKAGTISYTAIPHPLTPDQSLALRTCAIPLRKAHKDGQEGLPKDIEALDQMIKSLKHSIGVPHTRPHLIRKEVLDLVA